MPWPCRQRPLISLKKSCSFNRTLCEKKWYDHIDFATWFKNIVFKIRMTMLKTKAPLKTYTMLLPPILRTSFTVTRYATTQNAHASSSPNIPLVLLFPPLTLVFFFHFVRLFVGAICAGRQADHPLVLERATSAASHPDPHPRVLT